MARIRDDSEKLIELYAEIGLSPSTEEDGELKPHIIRSHPANYSNKEILSSVPFFTYPCKFQCDVVTHFSFVLTNSCSKWTFGYCRHTPNTDHCVVILSDLPWHSTFYKILDNCIEIVAKHPASTNLERFLNALMATEVPQPGLDLCMTYTGDDLRLRDFKVSVPDHQRLPRIPEDRNITEYFNAVRDTNMIAVFASMLNERRIVITSERLNRLSSCVQAANALIYPMHWQHIFIPLLPANLIDYLSAPMPFLIGVPSSTLETMRPADLADIVLLNVDTNELKTPFDDISTLPSDVYHTLRKALSKASTSVGDSLCRAFLQTLVSLIGGYRSALKIVPGELITFDNDRFVQNVRGTSRQLFLEKMLQLQIFQQFIETRLEMFNSGGTVDDQFEIELNHMEVPSGNRFKTQYKEWTSTMKKEGGALIRAMNSKSKVALNMSKQAVRNLKHYIATTPTGSAPSSPRISSTSKSLKKSISGSAISQTSKTVTYVRNPNGVNTLAVSSKSKFYYDGVSSTANNKQTPVRASQTKGGSFAQSNSLSSGFRSSSGTSFAPSASPESSDLEDSDDFVSQDFRKLRINAKNSPPDGTNGVNSFAPIPPPRSSNNSSASAAAAAARNSNSLPQRSSGLANGRPKGCTMNTEKCLIEFDSPPKERHSVGNNGTSQRSLLAEIDDSLAVFDPLLSGSTSTTLSTSSTNDSSGTNGSTPSNTTSTTNPLMFYFEANNNNFNVITPNAHNNNNNNNNHFYPNNSHLPQHPSPFGIAPSPITTPQSSLYHHLTNSTNATVANPKSPFADNFFVPTTLVHTLHSSIHQPAIGNIATNVANNSKLSATKQTPTPVATVANSSALYKATNKWQEFD